MSTSDLARCRPEIVVRLDRHQLVRCGAHSHEDEERRADNLNAALAREVIGQAQEILIERERISAAQAFEIPGLTAGFLESTPPAIGRFTS